MINKKQEIPMTLLGYMNRGDMYHYFVGGEPVGAPPLGKTKDLVQGRIKELYHEKEKKFDQKTILTEVDLNQPAATKDSFGFVSHSVVMNLNISTLFTASAFSNEKRRNDEENTKNLCFAEVPLAFPPVNHREIFQDSFGISNVGEKSKVDVSEKSFVVNMINKDMSEWRTQHFMFIPYSVDESIDQAGTIEIVNPIKIPYDPFQQNEKQFLGSTKALTMKLQDWKDAYNAVSVSYIVSFVLLL